MNKLKQIFDERGWTLQDAVCRGVPYVNLYKQLRGERSIGPRSAILYEEKLGIPRSELRPDLWPPKQPSSQAEK